MKKISSLTSAIIMLVLGILFTVLRGEVVGACITVLGVALIIFAVVEFIRGYTADAIVKSVLGLAVLLIGWLLIELAIFVIGLVLAAYGIYELVSIATELSRRRTKPELSRIFVMLAEPLVCAFVGLFLMFSRGNALSTAILISGIILIVDSVIALVNIILNKD